MTQITKKALAESLKKQMQVTPLEQITVSDVVKECGLNRRTLYYNFHDIYDLLEWIFKVEIKGVLGENRTSQTWKTGFLQIFIYLKKNKKIVLNTYNSIDRDLLENHLYDEIFNVIIEVVNELAIGLNVSEEDKKYVAKFYKILFGGIIIDWIKNKMNEDPEKIINNLDKLISGDIYKALLKYEKKVKPN